MNKCIKRKEEGGGREGLAFNFESLKGKNKVVLQETEKLQEFW